MSHLTNALATTDQIYKQVTLNIVPAELQDGVRFQTARLTQAAGILLNLTQDIIAQANITLFRYWVVEDLTQHEFSDVSAAVIYLTAKISALPRSLRSITNVYGYLLSPSSALSPDFDPASKPDPESYYVSESTYMSFRNRILHIEGQILNAIGFNTHVALPYSLAITYLQTLDVFGSDHPAGVGTKIAKRTVEYLNTALLSPQMLYLTHQPCALATAAIYLAARDTRVKLPDSDWWEVFDCDREELGFLAVGMMSLEGIAEMVQKTWGNKWMINRADLTNQMKSLGIEATTSKNGAIAQDEEAEMARLLDEKVDAQQ